MERTPDPTRHPQRSLRVDERGGDQARTVKATNICTGRRFDDKLEEPMNGSFFGRLEFYGGRYVVTIPNELVAEQDLHTGDTVDVHVESLAIRA